MSATGMWVEKYRPKEISEIVGQTEIIGSLSALIKDPTDMPHLMFSGSAGVGKTTTIGKLASQFKKKGLKVVLGASDTFRAAAIDQLQVWADRTGVPLV
ncbi:MAG: hypothetical protein MUP75_01455, partial [Nitrosopumilus sp.]|nr:hypothetical protein [Nitrosopumilus sp.]